MRAKRMTRARSRKLVWDVFISYASEDRDSVAQPLALLLQEAGLRVWFDKAELRIGDSLDSSIEKGLAESRFGIVILSKAYLRKDWPMRELRGLLAREGRARKVILPVWHGIDQTYLSRRHPLIAGKLAAKTGDGLDNIAKDIANLIRAEREAALEVNDAASDVSTNTELTPGPVFGQRMSYFADEKKEMTIQFTAWLMHRIDYLLRSRPGPITLLIGSGTTLYAFFKRLGPEIAQYARSGDRDVRRDTLARLKVVTNNLVGAQAYLDYSIHSRSAESDVAELVPCELLGGAISAMYAEVAGEQTNRAVTAIREGANKNATIISLLTSAWVHLGRNARRPLPVDRDSGFYCQDAVEAYEECDARFVICARKTSRLVEELRQAQWKSSPKTDADAECEFRYQPEGWSKPYRFVALRKEKPREERKAEETEQYQLFETSQYKYRVFVTDMHDPIYFVVWFYGQRGGAENLIKEANNDAGLAVHPSGRFDVNGNHFQLAMLAYNLNCWLMLFNREPQADATALRHTTLATSRLRFLFVAAKIWRHAGRTGVSYSDHYEEKGVFERLMGRLRRIVPRAEGYAPVMLPALC